MVFLPEPFVHGVVLYKGDDSEEEEENGVETDMQLVKLTGAIATKIDRLHIADMRKGELLHLQATVPLLLFLNLSNSAQVQLFRSPRMTLPHSLFRPLGWIVFCAVMSGLVSPRLTKFSNEFSMVAVSPQADPRQKTHKSGCFFEIL